MVPHGSAVLNFIWQGLSAVAWSLTDPSCLWCSLWANLPDALQHREQGRETWSGSPSGLAPPAWDCATWKSGHFFSPRSLMDLGRQIWSSFPSWYTWLGVSWFFTAQLPCVCSWHWGSANGKGDGRRHPSLWDLYFYTVRKVKSPFIGAIFFFLHLPKLCCSPFKHSAMDMDTWNWKINLQKEWTLPKCLDGLASAISLSQSYQTQTPAPTLCRTL